ncbi:MAG: TonB-dependent receptor [Bacteroidales bacterium]|nr:TonB-dependent receptor [Bacteroidales bacterium]
MEAKSWAHVLPGKEWNLILDGHFAWTRSINLGDPVDWSDQAIGKQLVYIPEFSGAITGRLRWKNWEFVYKWCYYSERYTTSSNNTNTRLGVLGPYFMNDMALERKWYFKRANLSVKGTVNNLFDEEYETVLSRPMPGINFELYLGITPKFSSTRK